jgi:hypothetical protein
MKRLTTPRDNVREEDLRGHGGEWYKKRLEKWESPAKKLEPWPRTGSGRDASWKPYAPEGVKGNNLNLNNVGREVGGHVRNKKREYLKDKINELAKQ